MLRNVARSTRRTRRVAPAVGLTCVLLLSACGSDGDESGGGEPSAEVGGGAGDGGTSSAGDSSGDDTDGGSGEGTGLVTVTMEDGTVYEFVDMSSCDTGVTDPSGLPSTGYDLTGRTADGEFLLSVGRAGFSDDETIFSGLLEGDFDDEGKNSKMLYSFAGIDGSEFVVDGANVAGTAEVRAIGPTRPHGDNSTATVEANC